MSSNTIEAFFVGTLADLDPNESNYMTENGAALAGTVVGGPGDQLYKRIESLTLEDPNSDGATRSNDVGGVTEHLTYDGTSSGLDSIFHSNVTVTYNDGSTVVTEMVVMQDLSGRVFLAPFVTGDSRNDVLDDRGIESIELNFVSDDGFSTVNNNLESNAFVICFTRGMRLLTPSGEVPVESLQVGDLVDTLDRGAQAIQWVGRSLVNSQPVIFGPGSMDPTNGIPKRRLAVSPQHRMLIKSPVVQRIVGRPEALVPAIRCLPLPNISSGRSGRPVDYFHLMFTHHEIIWAEGCPVESLYVGAQLPKALGNVCPEDRGTMLARFPARAYGFAKMTPARLIPTNAQARHIVARHLKNAKPLLVNCSLHRRVRSRDPSVVPRTIPLQRVSF